MNRQADFLRNVDPFKLSAFLKFLTTFFLELKSDCETRKQDKRLKFYTHNIHIFGNISAKFEAILITGCLFLHFS